jgi:hypothetical protein
VLIVTFERCCVHFQAPVPFMRFGWLLHDFFVSRRRHNVAHSAPAHSLRNETRQTTPRICDIISVHIRPLDMQSEQRSVGGECHDVLSGEQCWCYSILSRNSYCDTNMHVSGIVNLSHMGAMQHPKTVESFTVESVCDAHRNQEKSAWNMYLIPLQLSPISHSYCKCPIYTQTPSMQMM